MMICIVCIYPIDGLTRTGIAVETTRYLSRTHDVCDVFRTDGLSISLPISCLHTLIVLFLPIKLVAVPKTDLRKKTFFYDFKT